jgi:hypothetical protein
MCLIVLLVVPLLPAGSDTSPTLVERPGGQPAWQLDRGAGERCILLPIAHKLSRNPLCPIGAMVVHCLQARIPGRERLLVPLVSGIAVYGGQYLVHY